jgi:hypothetical protein
MKTWQVDIEIREYHRRIIKAKTAEQAAEKAEELGYSEATLRESYTDVSPLEIWDPEDDEEEETLPEDDENEVVLAPEDVEEEE